MRYFACMAVALALPAHALIEPCPSDCDGGSAVTVDEIVTTVGIALGDQPVERCIAADQSCDDQVTVDEVVSGVDSALTGCATEARGTLAVAASAPVGVIRTNEEGVVIGGTPWMPAQYDVNEPPEARVDVYAQGLEVPWAMAFAPDGRLFVTERPGRIRVIDGGVLQPTSWASPEGVHTIGESGLLGIAVHPNFPTPAYVYVCHTLIIGTEVQNRVVRFEEVDGRGANPLPIVEGFPGSSVHDGCRLKFGPDGKLYISTGDGARRALAQNLSSTAGKILRVNDDGSASPDNPFPEAPLVWSYGHRNPQGLAFHPETGELYATEHGPSHEIGIGAYDEVNRIEPGVNYGWPAAIGAPMLAQYRDPLLTYPAPSGPAPPSGASFYSGELVPEWQGDLFVGILGAEHLHRVGFDACGRIAALERLYPNIYGRLRDVVHGPDGALYVSTSNRDGRGTPHPDDDRILRISGS
ncbi:MAG TPA: PQQ-dependent sugar dehydrogenase [Terriglobales bacterium]|nr:PQQ-dependent sugar dehydrogenase [Terriglobales bacterium]